MTEYSLWINYTLSAHLQKHQEIENVIDLKRNKLEDYFLANDIITIPTRHTIKKIIDICISKNKTHGNS